MEPSDISQQPPRPPEMTPDERKQLYNAIDEVMYAVRKISEHPLIRKTPYTNDPDDREVRLHRVAELMVKLYDNKGGADSVARLLNRTAAYQQDPKNGFIFKPFEQRIFQNYLTEKGREFEAERMEERHERDVAATHEEDMYDRRKWLVGAGALMTGGLLGGTAHHLRQTAHAQGQVAHKTAELSRMLPDDQEKPSPHRAGRLKDDMAELYKNIEYHSEMASACVGGMAGSAIITALGGTLSAYIRDQNLQNIRERDQKYLPKDQLLVDLLLSMDEVIEEACNDAGIPSNRILRGRGEANVER